MLYDYVFKFTFRKIFERMQRNCRFRKQGKPSAGRESSKISERSDRPNKRHWFHLIY